MIFDLDGTLVQTEKLKALSYAQAAVELRPRAVDEDEVVEYFKEVVGLSRAEVARSLVDRFELEEKARARIAEFGVNQPWQAFVQIRLAHYDKMLQTPQVIVDHQWPHNLAVLEMAKTQGCRTGLATMSRCAQATRVLQILKLSDTFDFVATRDDVESGKPDPEIYNLVSDELEVPPTECLVIEDSPSGIRAALDAGMWCIAVTTPFTQAGVHKQGLLDEKWVVEEASHVEQVVQRMFTARRGD